MGSGRRAIAGRGLGNRASEEPIGSADRGGWRREMEWRAGDRRRGGRAARIPPSTGWQITAATPPSSLSCSGFGIEDEPSPAAKPSTECRGDNPQEPGGGEAGGVGREALDRHGEQDDPISGPHRSSGHARHHRGLLATKDASRFHPGPALLSPQSLVGLGQIDRGPARSPVNHCERAELRLGVDVLLSKAYP